MQAQELLQAMAKELPTILRQLTSGNAVKESAGLMRLRDFAEMSVRWNTQRMTRRSVLSAGATFAGLAIRPDD